MPADRFWELEDARLSIPSLAGRNGDTPDLGRLALVEFATVFGNDWFTVPVELAPGGIASVSRVTITDSFGRSETVAPAAGGWRLFAPDGSVLVVPPSSTAIVGPVVESIVIISDETANALWAIRNESSAPVPPTAPHADGLVFRVAPEPPEGWYALTATDDADRFTLPPVPDASQLLAELERTGIARSSVGELGATVRLRRAMARRPGGRRELWWSHEVDRSSSARGSIAGFDTTC
jgi:hypothetical protein